MHLNQRKEKLSRAYVSALCAAVGCSIAEWDVDDDSVDLTLKKRGLAGPIRTAQLDIQLKATSNPALTAQGISFPLKTKNFDDLRQAGLYPRILVLVTLPSDVCAEWIDEEDAERLALVARSFWRWPTQLPGSDTETSTTVHFADGDRFSAGVLDDLMLRISNRQPLVDE